MPTIAGGDKLNAKVHDPCAALSGLIQLEQVNAWRGLQKLWVEHACVSVSGLNLV